jgi:hypothetical protein
MTKKRKTTKKVTDNKYKCDDKLCPRPGTNKKQYAEPFPDPNKILLCSQCTFYFVKGENDKNNGNLKLHESKHVNNF